MKIGVVSDTHGGLKAWEDSRRFLDDTETIIHCGDVFNPGPGNPLPDRYAPRDLAAAINGSGVPLLMVKGNCDSEVDQLFLDPPLVSPILVYQVDFLKIVASHGHHFTEDEWLALGRKYKADILISGHTHRARLQHRDGVILLNPGSTALPKDGPPSVSVIDLHLKEIKIFDILNLSLITQSKF